MYKFIMIDDEEYAIDEISKMWDWNELGFELEGVFTDSEEALEFLESNHVDVIVSDIKMPVYSGIDIARICSEKYPDIVIMLLSAYRDFEYARVGMQYNVKRYLLKPISYDEIETAFKDICIYLDKKKGHSDFIGEELSMNRQALFSSIVYGVPVDNIDSSLQEMGIFSNSKEYPVLILNINIINFARQLKTEWKYGKENFYNAIERLICSEDEYAYYSVLSHSFDNILVICLGKIKDADLKTDTDMFVKRLEENLKYWLNLDARITVRQTFDSLSDVVLGDVSVSLTERVVKTVFSYIASGKIIEAKKMVRNVFEAYGDDDDFIRLLSENFVSALGNVLDAEQIFEPECICNSSDEYYEFIIDMINRAVSYMGSMNASGGNCIILKAISYVNEHYGEAITLEDVSGSVAFNSNYFSSYFKKYTGEKFVDFLIRFRVEKAMELIRRDKNASIQNICEKVGYNSLPHFYNVFKSYTGVTPAEYRKKLKKGTDELI